MRFAESRAAVVSEQVLLRPRATMPPSQWQQGAAMHNSDCDSPARFFLRREEQGERAALIGLRAATAGRHMKGGRCGSAALYARMRDHGNVGNNQSEVNAVLAT
jgi:hypothetical protein